MNIYEEIEDLKDSICEIKKSLAELMAAVMPFPAPKELSKEKTKGMQADAIDKKALRNRFLGTIILLLLFSALSAVLYHSIIFSVLIGISTAMLVILLYLTADFYLLPGDTFKRISENAIAASIFGLVIVLAFLGGLQFGEKISPERIAGEALQQVNSRLDNIDYKLDTLGGSNSSPSNAGESWDKGATR